MTTTISLAKPHFAARAYPPRTRETHGNRLHFYPRSPCSVTAASSPARASGPTINEIRTTTHFLENATFGPVRGRRVLGALARTRRPGWISSSPGPRARCPTASTAIRSVRNCSSTWRTAPTNCASASVFALSQIIVVSAVKTGGGEELTPWVRLLSRNAFGNYRTLLTDVTLSPTMGKYLDLAYNRKATSTSSPNENYARELMQLFTIGLWELNQDGTRQARRQQRADPDLHADHDQGIRARADRLDVSDACPGRRRRTRTRRTSSATWSRAPRRTTPAPRRC